MCVAVVFLTKSVLYQGGTSFVDLLCIFLSCVCYAFERGLFICAL